MPRQIWVTICRSVGVERTADKPLVAAGLVQRRERGMCARNELMHRSKIGALAGPGV